MDNRFISYKTITYARVNFLEEAIYSFLQQNDPNSEMVIVNDYPLQKLIFEHPQVKIYNFDYTFSTIGYKENFATEQCLGNIIIQGDDDDVALPNHFSNIRKYFKDDSNLLHWKSAVYYNDKQITAITYTGNSGIVYSKKVWKLVDKYPIENAGYDMTFVKSIHALDESKIVYANPAPEEVSWFYRWGGMGYHLSGQGDDKPNKPNIIQRHSEYIESQRRKGLIPTGEILLKPHWKIDYSQQLKDFVNKPK